MPRQKKNQPHSGRKGGAAPDDLAAEPRIIGGKYRGKKLAYEPHVQLGKKPAADRSTLVTRPMKHRVREAIFNLVGPAVAGKHALDLFAGTGALGLESLSRGASRATFIERHIPTAHVVRKNIATLGVGDVCTVLVTSAFLWAQRDLQTFTSSLPWLVFFSPPYDFYVDRPEEMLELIHALAKHAPEGSLLVVEADARFDFGQLPGGVRPSRHDEGWDVREYSPAVVGVLST